MWDPWQGADYSERRLLLLGESCYSWRDSESGELKHPEANHPMNTVEWIMANPRISMPFLQKMTRALSGVETPTSEQVREAWKSVAFTNYVPVTVGEGHGIRPKAAAWLQGSRELPEVLNMLAPRIVIVLGKTMWNRMPERQVIVSNDFQGYRLHNGAVAMCHMIVHPSRGPSWTEYAEFIISAEQATSHAIPDAS